MARIEADNAAIVADWDSGRLLEIREDPKDDLHAIKCTCTVQYLAYFMINQFMVHSLLSEGLT